MSSSIRSRSERWGLCFLLLSLWALVPRPAAGAELTDEAKAQARERFNAGNAAYEQGNFRQALEAFEAAYQLAPLPGFLFNVAQCHRQLGNFTRAASAYRRFLALSEKEPANAEMVRELIAEMDTQAKEHATSRPTPAKPVPLAKAPAKDRPEAAPSKVPGPPAEAQKEQGSSKGSERKPLDIHTSRALAVQERSLPPAAVPGPAVPEQREPLTRKWWVWAGAGAAAVVAGGIIYAVAAPGPRTPSLGTISGH